MDEPTPPESGQGPNSRHAQEMLNLLRRLSVQVARKRGIPDYEDDLAQEGFTWLWAHGQPSARRPSERATRRLLERLADTEKKRRERHRRRLRRLSPTPTKHRGRQGKAMGVASRKPAESAPRPVGIPTLCGSLAALGTGTKNASRLSTSLLAAAVTVAPDVLAADKLATFDLAYVHRRTAWAIARSLCTSPLGVTKRLQRYSRRIEKALARELAARLPPDAHARVLDAVLTGTPQKKGRTVVTSDDELLCEHLLDALSAVIHRDPGKSVSV